MHGFLRICWVIAVGWLSVRPAQSQPSVVEGKAPSVKRDQYGDPLPAGAVARIGCGRFRQLDVLQVLFSGDGKTLFALDANGWLVQWDVADGRELARLKGKSWIALSPDGKVLAALDHGGTAYLLDAATLKETKRLAGEKDAGLNGLAFSPDGRQLASSSGGAHTIVWDLETRERKRKLPYVGWDLGFSPDARWLAGTGGKVLDLATERHLAWHHGRAFAFSPQENRLAAGHTDGLVRVFEVPSGNELHCLKGHQDNISTVSFSPDGKLLASGCQTWSVTLGSADDAIRLWEVATGKALRLLPIGKRAVRALAFSRDGATLAAAVQPGAILLWDTMTGRSLHPPGADESVTALAFAPSGAVAGKATGPVLATCDAAVRVRDGLTGAELVRLADDFAAKPGMSALTFTRDGRHLVAVNGAMLRVWDVKTKQTHFRLPAPGNAPLFQAIAAAPDGKLLATAGDGCVRLIDADTGKTTRELLAEKPLGLTYAVAFSPDGRHLASGHGYDRICLWSVPEGILSPVRYETGSQSPFGNPRLAGRGATEVGPGPADSINSLSFSPDSRTLAAASNSLTGNLRLWDAATGRLKRRLVGHTHWVSAVSFAPDGRSLASAGWDGNVRVWELATTRPRAEFAVPRGIALAVAWSPDGRYLASVHQDGTAFVWDITNLAGDLPESKVLTRKDLDALWSELGDADAAKAFRAIAVLARSPQQALSLVKDRAKHTDGAAAIVRLVADLGDARFAVREKASRDLERYGELAEPALERLLTKKTDLETQRRAERILDRVRAKGPPTQEDWLRAHRVAELLWRVQTPAARQLLETWAEEKSSWLALESRATLEVWPKRPE